jgi:hypothetical protein
VLARWTGDDEVGVTTARGGLVTVPVAGDPTLADLIERGTPCWRRGGFSGPRSPVVLAVGEAVGAGVRFEQDGRGPALTADDLHVEVRPGPGGLHCRIRYAADLFDAGRIAGLAEQVGRVLAADPSTPLSRLPLLDDRELDRLRELGQGPRRDVPDETVHARMVARLREQPGAVAAVGTG